ncbi:MAG: hypothetical protein QXY45_02280 [Candidatus Aenigmatarchaeota archaeon]
MIFLLANKMSSKTSEDFRKTQKYMSNYLISLNLQSEIAKENICKVDVFELTEDKSELGKQLDILERTLGKDNEIVRELKKDYTLVSIRQWLLLKKFKQECNNKINIILFFYSNEVNSSDSESQGYVLDYIYRKYPEKVVIYAFEIEEDNPALNTIKHIYNVKSAPTIVVNERIFFGFQSQEKIESLLIK